MGQYDFSKGGNIYLIEDEEDVAELGGKDPSALSYVTDNIIDG